MPRTVITVPGRNPQPYRFQLDRKTVSLGRGSENDVVIDDGSVSVKHAVMERIEGGYQLRDAGSTNGIKLDGKRMETVPLRSGLTVKIGDVSFDFTLTDEELEALNREKPLKESPIIKEEEIEEEDYNGPRKAAPAGRAPVQVVYHSGPGPFASLMMTVIFIALAAGAFWVGLSLKYSQRNKGESLLKAVKAAHAEKPAGEDKAATEDGAKKPE